MPEREMEISQGKERSMARAMCGVLLKEKTFKELMLMLGSINQLAMAICVHWYGNVIRREDCYVMRRASNLEVEDKRKKGRLKRTLKNEVEEESMKVDLSRKSALYRSMWCWH